MALNPNKNLKLYYSIKEVAQMFDINESTLRYWETEFPHLRPKTQAGTKVRQYTQQDIEAIKIIYNLVKVRGMKLEAAAALIRKNKDGVEKTSELVDNLRSIRSELAALRTSLSHLQ